MEIDQKNNPQQVFDKSYSLSCPHCGVYSAITAISIPRYEHLQRFRPTRVGVAYRCNACNEPVFLRFTHIRYQDHPNTISIEENTYEMVERAQETFEYQYLPDSVAQDFEEALTCYSASCYNAFAAMCRRTIQSACTGLGADGKSKVHQQLKDAKDTAQIDDETYGIMEQIIITGHDGAHPHLPALSGRRAGILLELMKDVLYQLIVRQEKLKELVQAREEAIEERKQPDS